MSRLELFLILLSSLSIASDQDSDTAQFLRATVRNPCLNAPCHNGICVNEQDNTSFRCYCINGYTGLTCSTNFDDCMFKPCQNGATCIDGVAEVTCLCSEGFAGYHCEENVNECLSNPCRHGGVCKDLINGYLCYCLPGYLGTSCEVDLDICNSSTHNTTLCFNGGTCIDGPGESFNCSCPEGFVGDFCEQDESECISSPCLHGGLCVEVQGNFSCNCPFGWTGRFCEVELHECEENVCQNDAICLVQMPFNISFNSSGPECFCVPDYHGQFCEMRYNECLAYSSCINGATCIDGIDSYTCVCPPYFTGVFCELEYKCENNSSCSDIFELESSFELYSDYFTSSLQPFTFVEPFESTYSFSLSEPFFNESLISSPSTEEFSESLFESLIDIQTSSNLSITSYKKATDYSEEFNTPFDSFSPESQENSINFNTSFLLSEFDFISSDELRFESSLIDYVDSEFFLRTDDVQSDYSLAITSDTSDTSLLYIDSISLFSTTSSTILQEGSSSVVEPFTEQSLPDWNISLDSYWNEFTDSEASFSEQSYLIFSSFYESNDYPIKPSSLDSYSYTIEPSSLDSYSYSEYSLISEKESEVIFTDITESLPNSIDFISTSFESGVFSVVVPNTNSSVLDQITIESSYDEILSTSTSTFSDLSSVLYSSSIFPTTEPSLPNDCQDLICQNGGTVYKTSSDLIRPSCQCICSLYFAGAHCELETLLSIPYFTGRESYLEHSIPGVTLQRGLDITISFRTLSPEGILLYTQASNASFLLLSMESGRIKFTFSCGNQVTVFVERGLNATQGYFTSVTLGMQWVSSGGDPGDCEAWMHVNATSFLTGSQRLQGSLAPDLRFGSLFLGGLDKDVMLVHSESVRSLPSFIGCMKDLQLNGQEQSIIQGALRGAGVNECRTGGCSLHPCHNGGTCHSTTTSWYCICSAGFTGSFCEHTTCVANPCQFGGTCLPQKVDTYLCLCPVGKHGKICQHSVDISRPAYFGNLQGYTSYLQYLIPGNVQTYLEVRFRFTISHSPFNSSLLFYMGQTGVKDPMTDFFALGLDNGYLNFIYNLGSGTRQIRTPEPLDQSIPVHSVQFGHQRRYGWLVADANQRKAFGLSEGHLTSLNVARTVFFGGHESFRFLLLPSDLQSFRGFRGCIFDEEWRTTGWGNFERFQNFHSGRNIHQCEVDECQLAGCANGASCVPEGATFRCVCSKGWTGSLCKERFTPCTAGNHNCSAIAVCVPLEFGYSCDCPLGTSGKFCEHNKTLSDVHFSGVRSFMAFEPRHIRKSIRLVLSFQTLSPEGILFYTSQHSNNHAGDFAALVLSRGFLQFRFNLGTGPGRTFVLQSKQLLEIGSWYRVEAGRNGTHGFLHLNNSEVSGYSKPGMDMLDAKLPFFLGGIEDLSTLNKEATEGLPVWFKGCVRYFEVNKHKYDLNEKESLFGKNVEDCDGTVCGFNQCLNNGICIPQYNVFHCQCVEGFVGTRCETPIQCSSYPCHNGGTCFLVGLKPVCDCPFGWSGSNCNTVEEIVLPRFQGNGYILCFDKEFELLDHQETHISFNFSTVVPSSMLMWNGQAISDDEDYLGVGLIRGRLLLVWNLGWLSSSQILTVNEKFNDGNWHSVVIHRLRRTLTLLIDDQQYESHVEGDYFELNTKGYYYLGGFPRGEEISTLTSGHFSLPFEGCLSSLLVAKEILNVTAGANILNCWS